MPQLPDSLHIALLAAVLFFISCKKDKDNTAPQISVESPAENASYDVFENIAVKAQVTDESTLSFVSIKLLKTDLVPVLPTITLSPDGNTYALYHIYPLDDIHLSTGIYYLQIKASDGENEASAYIKLNIGEVPLQRTGVVLVSTPTGNSVDVAVMDNAYQINPKWTLQSDYAGSAASSYYQYLGILPAYNGDFTAFDLSNGSSMWSVSTPGNFEGLGFSDEVMYVCYHSGQVLGFDHNGGQVYSAYSYTNWYPEKCFGHGEMLLVQEQFVSSSTKKLSAYYKATGENSNRGFTMNFDIVAMGEKDADNVFLFVNENNNGRILLMETGGQSYGYWEPHTLSSGLIYAAAQVDGDNYIIAHASGLLWYRYSNNSLTTFAAVTAQDVEYDLVYNQVIAAVGSEIKTFAYPGGQLIGSATHTSAVRDMHILYNK